LVSEVLTGTGLEIVVPLGVGGVDARVVLAGDVGVVVHRGSGLSLEEGMSGGRDGCERHIYVNENTSQAELYLEKKHMHVALRENHVENTG
jgi:hypothetical protein